MDLFNFIISNPSKISEDELREYQDVCDETCNYLLDGISSIGNLLHWASDNDDYNDRDIRADIRKIGLMLSVIPDVIHGIRSKLSRL